MKKISSQTNNNPVGSSSSIQPQIILNGVLTGEHQKKLKIAQGLIDHSKKIAAEAMNDSNDEKKIALFGNAQKYNQQALNTLMSLSTLDVSETQLSSQKIKIQISLELTTILEKKAQNSDNLDEKIEYLTLTNTEIQKTLVGLEILPDKDVAYGMVEDRKRHRAQNQIHLTKAFVLKARNIDDKNKKIQLYKLALNENDAAIESLKEFQADKKIKNAVNAGKWNEWTIKLDLEHVIYNDVCLSINRTLEAQQNLYQNPYTRSDNILSIKVFQDRIDDFVGKNQISIDLLTNLYDISQRLFKEKLLFNCGDQNDRNNFNKNVETIKTKLMMGAVSGTYWKVTVAIQRLANIGENSNPEIGRYVSFWLGQYAPKFELLLGTFDTLVNPLRKEESAKLSELKKSEVLLGLSVQLDELSLNAKWMGNFLETNKLPAKDIEQIASLSRNTKELQHAIQFELENIKSVSGLNLASELRQKDHRENIDIEIIATKYDGNLLGVRQGENAIVKNYMGNSVAYRKIDNQWIQETSDQESVATLAELDEEFTAATVEEKKLEYFEKKLVNAINKVDELEIKSDEYISLAKFTAKNQGFFSNFDSILRLAIDSRSQSITILNKLINGLTRYPDEHKTFSQRKVEELNEKIGRIQTEQNAMFQLRLDTAKKLQPSGPALNFLLDEQQIRNVTRAKAKISCQGIVTKSGLCLPDFMDEHKIYVHGVEKPFILHTHYRKRDASLDDKTSSHFKIGNENSAEVSLDVLRKLHGTFS